MKKSVCLLIVVMSCLLCVPGPGFSKMTAMTDEELDHLSGQKGTALLPSVMMLPIAITTAMSGEWTAIACDGGNGAEALYHMAEGGLLPLDTPIQLDVSLTGESAESFALPSFMLVAGAAGLVNPLLPGFLCIGSIPGAFDVSMGDVAIELSGTIECSVHP